ncbi:hypothetical protein HMPREF0970_02414 [Schaalia odontolytica F0309]|uniref:Uncharacterized protein n=1 Tax=Schaalia odontolytica F0309 TaxID=649742 RepID=D4U2F7_9ACTO|nr:hypothetical protein HMPREF0970_02414 [Schaalia odontolytica F0309]
MRAISLFFLSQHSHNEGTPSGRGALMMHPPTGICVQAASACG